MTAELLARWTAVLGHSPEVVAAGQELLARWAEPHRGYHDAQHLAEVVAALDALHPDAPVPAAVLLAAYWHDAVYEGTPDDERASADLARRALTGLGVDAGVVDEVARLVLLTADHRTEPGDAAGALLCDADLAVLASGPDRYASYVAGVRREYAAVPAEDFRRGRAAVLQALLALPRLYGTAAGRERWEAAARRNLEAEVAALSGASCGAAPPP